MTSCSPFIPAGSYQSNATNIVVTLTASCLNEEQIPVQSVLTFNQDQLNDICDIANNNGSLALISGSSSIINTSNPYIPAGSYQNSSSGVVITLAASCPTATGAANPSSTTYSAAQAGSLTNIANNNGNLELVPSPSSTSAGESTPAGLISGLGVGFNTFTATASGSAISATSPTVSQGLTSKFFMRVCASIESFNQATSHAVGVTAQISSSGPTGGANTTLSNALSLSDTSISVVVYSSVVTNSLAYDSCSLANGLSEPATTADCLTFYQNYGDSFVSAITEGGMYMACIVFYSQTEQDQKAVQASLSANGVVNVEGSNLNLGATVGGGIGQTINTTNVRCSIYQSLLGSTATIPTEDNQSPEDFVEAIISFAEDFSSSEVNEPVIFDYATQGYETIFSSTSEGFDTITLNRSIYTGSVGPNLAYLQSLDTQYAWITTAYQAYDYTGDNTFLANQNQLAEDIDGLNQWLTPVVTNPTIFAPLSQSLNPPQSLLNGVPVFSYATPTQATYGGAGGAAYQDINVGSSANATTSTSTSSTAASGSASASVQSKSSPTLSGSSTEASSVTTTGLPLPLSNLPVISSITLWGGDWMNQMQINYSSLGGAAQFTHGTVGGAESTPLELTTDQFINAISGIAGDYINQLNLSTTATTSLQWPTNPQSSGSFSWALPAGCVLVGFQGRSGSYLNALEPIVIQLQPTKWIAPSLTPQPYTEVMPVAAIGVGYNTFTGSALPNSALSGASLGSQGVQSTSLVKVCASVESLEETLSQTSGFSIGVPGVFKISHTKTKTESLNVSDTAVSVVVVSKVVTDSPVYTSCGMSTAVQGMEPQSFYEQYGDSYISSTVNGGEYVAVFVYDCQTMTESQSVQKSLSAGIDADGASVNASLASTLNNAQSAANVACTCHQSVRGSSNPLPALTLSPSTDINNLINYAAGFDGSSVDAPVVLSYTTTGYESLAPTESNIQNMITNRKVFTTQVAPMLSQLMSIWSQILNLAKTYQIYGYSGDPNISFPVVSGSKSGDVASAINGLNTWIDAVALNPFINKPLPADLNPPVALANGSPTLVMQTPTNPLWGSNCSTPYQDIDIGVAIATTNTALNTTSSNPNPIPLKSRPVIGSITLSGGDWMNELSVTYDMKAGPTTFTHGQNGGASDYPINLQVGEFITSVSGSCGDYINQLTFKTNLGQSYTFPPSPQSTGGVVSWSAAPGEVLVGFQGSSGAYLNQLQLITVQFQPSTWTPPLLTQADAAAALPVTCMGVGFNTILNGAMPNTAAIAPASVGSQNVCSQNFVQVCTSSSSLDQTLHHSIGGSAQGQSVKHQSAHSLQTSDTDVSIVIYANAIKNSPVYTTSPTLLPGAAALSPSELFTAYGDSYVSAAVMGAEYVAVFIYECDTESQQQSVLNSLALQGVVPSDPPVSIGGNFSKSMSSANSQINVNCRCVQLLRGSAAAPPEITNDSSTNITALVNFALALNSNDIDGEGVVLEFSTTGYETLMDSEAAAAFAPIVNNRQTYTNAVAPSLASLISIRNAMQQVASLYKTYGYTSDKVFTANCQQLNQDTAALETWIVETNANPIGIATYPNPPQSLINGTPAAQVQLETTTSAWGGSTANESKKSQPTSANGFCDLATSWATSSNPTNASDNSSNPSTPIPLADRPVLAAVDLWGGGQMNQIATSYQTTSGTVQFVHGNSSSGWMMPSFNLGAGEFITSITGNAGWYIYLLTMNTNNGQSVTWFPGCDSGTSFSWSVPEGATLVGFQGSSGEYLNSLQPIYLQFQPASWTRYASAAQYVPAGSYQQTSTQITIELQAQCRSATGDLLSSSLTFTTEQAVGIADISNENGVLTIVTGNGDIFNPHNSLGAFIPSGSYQTSSSNVSVTLSANCLNSNQQSVPASLTYTSNEAASFETIENNNGSLASVVFP
ncbi:MAG: jacalin-like lectin [Cyanobacteriota bacterium]|nr:jacalin-like lectin [Cyanobacteriota bacterium]